MSEILPSFKKPPLVEVATSVQFKAIPEFTNAHIGVFWNENLRAKYPKAVDAQPIAPQSESFEPSRARIRLPNFRIGLGDGAARLQAISDNDQTMVQVQNGRIVFNWRKLGENEYPRWSAVSDGFRAAMTAFGEFLASQGKGEIEANQWEVTYVNHLIRGQEWESPADWPALIPGLIGPTTDTSRLEGLECNYHFTFAEEGGRLHVELARGFSSPDSDAHEILGIQLTARGGVDRTIGRSLAEGLERGRDAIVRKFTQITGEAAHRRWEREK